MKPVIGLVPLVDEGRKSLWMLPGYMEGIAGAGGLSFMLPLSGDEADLSRLFSLCDGLLLTGGHDVSPALYGEAPLPVCGACCPERDRMESILLRLAMAENKPVLGICRGLQFMNAALGGSLWQDLPSQHPSGVNHHGAPPYDRPVHEVSLVQDSPLQTLLGQECLFVNSSHHQAVKALAPGLVPMAFSPDGLTEAVYMPGKPFFWAVQWHPERLFRKDEGNGRIFRAFIDAMA